MKLLKSLPFIFGGAHAILSIGIFGLAITDPERKGLLPLVMYFVDYPCSILIESLCRSLRRSTGDIFLVGGVVYGIVGSLWFFLIGFLIRAVTSRFVNLTAKRTGRAAEAQSHDFD
jgi:hypothetical protein